MSTHIAAPTAPPTAVFPTTPGWLTLSAAFGDEVPAIADRDDLVVTVAPGAGRGAPACFVPDVATIEVDGSHIDAHVDPATVAPHRVGDRKRYGVAWGLLTHECAHAKHSQWRAPTTAPPGARAAAELLEESRIEAAHLRRRPADRYWLRASATNLILADTQATAGQGPAMTADDAARCAALLLARVDGGVLTTAETAPVATVIDSLLGSTTREALREIWQQAHTTADDDAEAMIELGRRWCVALGTDPHQQPPTPGTSTPTAGSADSGAQPSGAPPSPLTEAVAATTQAVRRAVATAPAPSDPVTRKLEARAADDEARERARSSARAVFNGGRSARRRGAPLRGTRTPTHSERNAARQLARALTTAGTRERTPTKTRSTAPPGRLSMRGAMAADAQRAAGAIPTAEPFTRTTRTTVPAPPLRIGIACDVSGSMASFAEPTASAAWILAEATRHTAVVATSAAVIFGHTVRPVTHPGTTPPHVTEFGTGDRAHQIDTAISALDGALNLGRPDAARLLVIISDGRFETATKAPAQRDLDRLRANGCGVLWLEPHTGGNEPMRGATVHTLTDPTTTARAIGRAATAALRAAH
ncbi:VWA domain-containing protein [Prauserella alba]|uniref:VWA domain containing CoxE-like protein n=1 Tax=Prauserella alba TaxID=176898 RepID=A0ABP4G5H2_9PSEU|nr:VWA domain-containing protein [Prauserella alba]MCP2182175.1 VWA domain containing CoxE-like protein [Prauserella alba]